MVRNQLAKGLKHYWCY